MSRFLHSGFRTLLPYVPGEQPKDQTYIKLNTNESPFPPGPKVLSVINQARISELRLYEDPTNSDLKAALAETFSAFGLKPENFCPTGGSDEALELAFMAFGEDGIQFPDLTYGFYSVFTELHHMDARIIPVREDFSIDIRDYQRDDRAIVFANPNAPTGLFLSEQEVREILEKNPNHIVIVDEAYVDFGGQSMLSLIPEYPNLLVCQTFSKSRSLAGARVGFAAGSAELMGDLERIRNSRNPYNISRLSQLAGAAALSEPAYYKENCQRIMESRAWTVQELRALGFRVSDSLTNFVFAKSDRLSGEEVYTRLREKGILVRHFSQERIKDYNRITIGTRQDMEALIAALKDILGKA